MKIFIYILMLLAASIIIYNFTLLDFDDIMGDRSALALIGIVSATCVIVLMAILLTSKAIEKKHNQ
jgi:uncharacterized membrane protein YgaE (UPF0421/DUF939 family)